MIIDRATDAFREAYTQALLAGEAEPMRRATAELLAHISGELLALDEAHPGIAAHQVAHFLTDAWRAEVGV